MTNTKNTKSHVQSYLYLKRGVGFLGIFLPVILLVGNVLFIGTISPEESISHYYYTPMRDVFVGVLFCVGLFMCFYTGYSKKENIITNVAGVSAFLVALLPTKNDDAVVSSLGSGIIDPNGIGSLHYIAAGLLFGCMTYMCFRVFTENGRRSSSVPKWLFYLYGNVMALSCLAIALQDKIFMAEISNLTFYGETVALVAFGSAWLSDGDIARLRIGF